MTLYDVCVTELKGIDPFRPVSIMKLHESLLTGDCYYEPFFVGRFEDIPLKALVCEVDTLFIDASTGCINIGII